MGLIVILPIAALSGWSIFAIFRWLRRGDFNSKWWRAFALLASAGLAVGIWFAFFIQYKVANTHLAGFPIPVAIANREKPDAPWVDATMPASIRFGGTVTNLLSGVALCLAPIAVAAFFKENRGQDPEIVRANSNPP
jgi:uncharacterized membrane protein YfcA